MSTDPLLTAQLFRLNIDRLRRSIRSRSSIEGIPRGQEAALSQLSRKGPMAIADLARWELIRPQSMGVIVADLLAAGLVSKSPDTADGRRGLLDLTPEGVAALQDISRRRDADFAALMETQLTDAERETVAEAMVLLERITREDS
ncbi:MarR family winged helix-turn-helix transcriptional regulator [Glaciihabitans sp. dw_435]|uniref:MarR family winged helix-turn-helix transcriptional regulator n=1 Tax=Glaciihabitans sp. dw_435 TaxID=2720081 RepID=UPI001BD2CFBA|nr:MarR family transcriptional regulator [Glaciihabitans sp. dw_435]